MCRVMIIVPMIKIYALLFYLLLVPLAGFSQLGFHFERPLQHSRIYSEIHSNLFVVPIQFNRKIPLFFILDTGVRNSILTEKSISDLLKVKYVRKYTIKGVGEENVVDAYLTNDISISLQGIRGNGNSLLVLEKDYIELTNFLGTNVHGMFGYELFSRFIVQMHYGRKFIKFIDAEIFRIPKRYTKIPISIEDTKPYIFTQVVFKDGSQNTLKLLVDTGASHGLMLDPNSDQKVKIPEKTIDANIGRGLGGNIEGQIGRIESIEFGDYKLDDVIASFPYEGSYTDSLTASTVFRHGSIGGEVLSRFNVIFDYSKEAMYIKKNNTFSKGFYYNLSGLTLKTEGENLERYIVEEVRESSPAYISGVREKDQILSINSFETKTMNLSEINSFFNSKPGKSMTLEVRRGKEILRLKFKLQQAV